jgi:hypothetical protein
MAIEIHCYEPENRPHRAQLTLGEGVTSFWVYLLTEVTERRKQREGLRWTALGALDEPAPPESTPLMRVDVLQDPPDSGQLVLCASKLAPEVHLEVNFGSRSERVSEQTRIPSGMTLTLKRETIAEPGAEPAASSSDADDAQGSPQKLSLQLRIEAVSTTSVGVLGAVSGLDAPDDLALADAGAVLWAMPTAAGAFAAPTARVATAIKTYAKGLNVPPALVAPLLLGLTMLLGMGYATWKNQLSAKESEARAAEKEAALASVSAQLEIAKEGERDCMGEREELTVALGDANARLDTLLDQSLRRTEILTLASALAGERVLSESARAFDEQGWKALKALLTSQVAHARVNESLVAPCLAQRDALGEDLPTYALLWHPDARLQCPEGYDSNDGLTRRAGRWGLSDRAATLYGEGFTPGVDTREDPRLRDAWAAQAYAAGLRDTLRGVLTAQTPGRPPVAPSAAALWALALWDAYNHLPMPAKEEDRRLAGECATALVEAVARAQTVTAPGQPALPELAAVARGESFGSIPSTSACAWPDESLQRGAARALQAVAREVALQLATPDDGA